jgi:hypothetical protein
MPPTELNACRNLAALADQLAVRPDIRSPREFIYCLGEQAAGIRQGPWRYFDLLKGGRTLLPGGGFRPQFDDNSGGQTRHFIGIAVSSLTFGPKLTVWLSENIRRDRADRPDGQLTLAAIQFTQKLLAGELLPTTAGEWICANLCLDCP